MRIGIVGDETSVLGFKALGLATFVARADSAAEVWKSIPFEEFGLLFVTEEVREALEAAGVDTGRAGTLVAAVPSLEGGGGRGAERIRSLVEKATGTTMIARAQDVGPPLKE